MTTNSINPIANISNSYTAKDTQEADDYLGKESFLTMLVAQLQNQDPLNPMEGTDFSTQLAQFSQLEQAIQTNTNLTEMISAFNKRSETDLNSYLSKLVVAEANAVEVSGGISSGIKLNLENPSTLMISIYDGDGNKVRDLNPIYNAYGSYEVDWDGCDNSGELVADGSYTFSAKIPDGEGGLTELQNTVKGKVQSVMYRDSASYLQVLDETTGSLVSVNAKSVLSVQEEASTNTDNNSSPTNYIGKNVTASIGLLNYNSQNSPTLKYKLDKDASKVDIQIYDLNANLVKTVNLTDLEEGENKFVWDGTNDEGESSAKGIYSYMILTDADENVVVDSSVEGEVQGIVYYDGTPFLQGEDSADDIFYVGINDNLTSVK